MVISKRRVRELERELNDEPYSESYYKSKRKHYMFNGSEHVELVPKRHKKSGLLNWLFG